MNERKKAKIQTDKLDVIKVVKEEIFTLSFRHTQLDDDNDDDDDYVAFVDQAKLEIESQLMCYVAV